MDILPIPATGSNAGQVIGADNRIPKCRGSLDRPNIVPDPGMTRQVVGLREAVESFFPDCNLHPYDILKFVESMKLQHPKA